MSNEPKSAKCSDIHFTWIKRATSMKKIIVLILLFSACVRSPQDKAKALIDHELRTTLHDYKSYEPVEFGKWDSSYTIVADFPAYQDLFEKYNSSKKETEEALKKMELYVGSIYSRAEFQLWTKRSNQSIKDMGIYNHSMDSINKKFKPEFNGWHIKHSFRAKSLAGNLGIHHYDYYFDKDISKIIKKEDISESSKTEK